MIYGWLLIVCSLGSHSHNCLPPQPYATAEDCSRMAKYYREAGGSRVSTRCVQVRKKEYRQ